MKSNNLTLGEILAYPSQYVIPVFQRHYRWDQPQWEKLWADLAALREPGKTGRHFMGFLVLVPESVGPGQVARYHLIDGQQRLTTLTLVLCALRDAARQAGLEELAQQVELTTLTHQFNKGIARYRVYPKLRDRDQYVACVDGRPAGEGRVGAAVRYFAGRLATIPGAGTDDGLRSFFGLLTGRLEFVYAQLEGENPFNIFKSLNSTGVPLGQSDLIRNFVFMNVPVAEQDEFDEALWRPVERQFADDRGNLDGDAFSAFLRDHLMSGGQYVPPSESFDAFQRHHEATAFDPRRVAEELGRAAGWYRVLRGDTRDPSQDVESALGMLRQLESSTTYALLMNLLDRRERGRLGDVDLAGALRMLAGFILRRLVCGENSRGYARMFVQAAGSLGDDAVGDLRRFLEARGFPGTPRFEQDFVRFNLYGSRYRKAVLEALERDQEPKEPADLTNAQVEHVMPQTLSDAWRADLGPDAGRIHAAWLHTPGNLTLTGYNPELHNRPFAEKRRRYDDSNVAITRDLAGHAAWGEAEIEARGRRMAESAARIWPGPATPVTPPVRPSPGAGGSFRDLRRRFWTEFRAYLAGRTTAFRPRKATGDSGLKVASWPGGVSLWTHANMQNGRLMVALGSRRPDSPELLRHLLAHRDEIEAEIGSPLVWDGVAKKGVLIVLRNPTSPADEALWPACFDWLARTLETFHQAFIPRLERFRNAAASDLDGEMTGRARFLIDYWTALREHVAASGGTLAMRKPRPEHWTTVALGKSQVHLYALVDRKHRRLAVQVAMAGKHSKARFARLAADRDQIENEFGAALDWAERPGKFESHIGLRKEGVDPDDRSDWPAQHEWLRQTIEDFRRVFIPRLAGIDEVGDRSPAGG